jgi:hypothetical protein
VESLQWHRGITLAPPAKTAKFRKYASAFPVDTAADTAASTAAGTAADNTWLVVILQDQVRAIPELHIRGAGAATLLFYHAWWGTKQIILHAWWVRHQFVFYT